MGKPIPFKGFVGSAYGPQSPNVDAQDLINYYLEISESPWAKKPTGLLPCPGFTIKCTLPTSPVRGEFADNDRLFAVGGGYLYEISRQYVITARPMTVLSTPVGPAVAPSPLTPALAAPGAPVVTHGGALGTTTYGYQVTAFNALGETTGSSVGSSALGNAALSATNYNMVAWLAVANASGYKIYRTAGPDAGKLVGVIPASQLFLLDLGTAGTAASPPGSNTSGGVAGTTTYGYKIVATLGLGETAASTEGVTNAGQATLSEDNFNTITWPAVPNAHNYKVFRTTGGVSPPVLLGTTDLLTFDDIGEDGEADTPSTADTTGTSVITDDGTPVSISSSGDAGGQLLIVGGGAAFCYDLETNTLAKVVDGATAGGYIGTYFVVLDAATSTLKVSELLDGFAWDLTQLYQRQIAGDRWLAMAVTDIEIWLLGSATSEVWQPTGVDETRFAPNTNVFIEQGIIATASLSRLSGTLVWVGQNRDGAGIVWRTDGYAVRQISMRGIERALERYDTLADAVAWTYEQEGHTFYVLTFPSDDATWAYDILTGEWHKRGFWNPNIMAFEAYRPQCHAFAFGGVGFGVHLVGDRESGVIASLSTDVATDIDGTSLIRRVRQSPHVSDDQATLFTHSFQIDVEVGLGLASGQGRDPTLMLQVSDDGGKTWGSERWRSAGAQGAYTTRVIWNRCGASRDRVYRLVVTDPVPWRIASASFDLEGGTT